MVARVLGDNISALGWLSVTAPFARRVALLSLLVLVGCATAPADLDARAAYDQANDLADPAEPTNRTIFAGNQWVDRNALRPAARAYQDNVPSGVRRSLRNFTLNLKGPSILVNDVMQGNFNRAWTTTQRFVVNTTVGGLGLFDVATDWDLARHDADFGQTFGVWGMGPGPSAHLPLFGPSNVRDTAGRLAGFVINPLGSGDAMQTVKMTSMGVSVVDQRAETLPVTENLEKTSLDYYAALRSMHAQHRVAFVEEGREGRAGAPGASVKIGPAVPAPAETPASDKPEEGQ